MLKKRGHFHDLQRVQNSIPRPPEPPAGGGGAAGKRPGAALSGAGERQDHRAGHPPGLHDLLQGDPPGEHPHRYIHGRRHKGHEGPVRPLFRGGSCGQAHLPHHQRPVRGGHPLLRGEKGRPALRPGG